MRAENARKAANSIARALRSHAALGKVGWLSCHYRAADNYSPHFLIVASQKRIPHTPENEELLRRTIVEKLEQNKVRTANLMLEAAGQRSEQYASGRRKGERCETWLWTIRAKRT